jgi:hypothetical protein
VSILTVYDKVAIARVGSMDAKYPLELSMNDAQPRPPVTIPEVVAVLLLVALCDVTIYRGQGFAGVAVLLVCAPLLFILGTTFPKLRATFWLLVGILVVLAARLVWLGSVLGVACGIALLVALAIALQGRRPHVLNVLAEAVQTVVTGYRGLLDYGTWAAKLGPRSTRLQWLALVLPLTAVVFFGALFVMANPDVVTWVGKLIESWVRVVHRWWMEIPFYTREVLFWIVVAWFVIGLLRPRAEQVESIREASSANAGPYATNTELSLYSPFRNTLVSVIVLFAAYLVFEFRTLWFREFPPGFYYAGYAHEGAAWLTTALAFATLTLSLIFRGPLLADPRISRLRLLAWVWSAENLLLALTVFNRLHIYVAFNGMTRMRMVALFGISTVIAGFVLVVWKIVRNHNFAWLVRNQLWALAIAIYLFAITPIDAVVHRYNVRHVLAGDLPPAVQIAVHPINSEGVLMLEPLLDCQDSIIREGIQAIFARRALELENLVQERVELGWTSYQAADNLCLKRLRACQNKWNAYLNDRQRAAAFERFYEYAYQWY